MASAGVDVLADRRARGLGAPPQAASARSATSGNFPSRFDDQLRTRDPRADGRRRGERIAIVPARIKEGAPVIWCYAAPRSAPPMSTTPEPAPTDATARVRRALAEGRAGRRHRPAGRGPRPAGAAAARPGPGPGPLRAGGGRRRGGGRPAGPRPRPSSSATPRCCASRPTPCSPTTTSRPTAAWRWSGWPALARLHLDAGRGRGRWWSRRAGSAGAWCRGRSSRPAPTCWRPGSPSTARRWRPGSVSLGYARVPLVEDPGTFAVRGGILDLWSPAEAAAGPARVLRRRGGERAAPSTRSRSAAPRGRGGEVLTCPAREALFTEAGKAAAREAVRAAAERGQPAHLAGARGARRHRRRARPSSGRRRCCPASTRAGSRRWLDYLPAGTAAYLDEADAAGGDARRPSTPRWPREHAGGAQARGARAAAGGPLPRPGRGAGAAGAPGRWCAATASTWGRASRSASRSPRPATCAARSRRPTATRGRSRR